MAIGLLGGGDVDRVVGDERVHEVEVGARAAVELHDPAVLDAHARLRVEGALHRDEALLGPLLDEAVEVDRAVLEDLGARGGPLAGLAGGLRWWSSVLPPVSVLLGAGQQVAAPVDLRGLADEGGAGVAPYCPPAARPAASSCGAARPGAAARCTSQSTSASGIAVISAARRKFAASCGAPGGVGDLGLQQQGLRGDAHVIGGEGTGDDGVHRQLGRAPCRWGCAAGPGG